MKLSVNCGVGAIFKCVVRKADTHEIVKETPEFHNLVLNSGLARMSVGTWINRCVVGSGNSEPVATQNSLDAFISSTTITATGIADSGGIQVTNTPFYWFGRRTWRFATGTATGNLSEIGLGWGDSNLWNRALIRDNSGNPTTITVLSDEYLDVFCEVRVYPSDGTGSFDVIDKLGNLISTHSYVAKALYRLSGASTGARGAYWAASQIKIAAWYYGAMGFCISNQDFINDNATTPTRNSMIISKDPIVEYSSGSCRGTATTTSTEANSQHKQCFVYLDGLMCVATGSNANEMFCGYKWKIDPPIAKTNAMILTYSFSISWGRYEPS